MRPPRPSRTTAVASRGRRRALANTVRASLPAPAPIGPKSGQRPLSCSSAGWLPGWPADSPWPALLPRPLRAGAPALRPAPRAPTTRAPRARTPLAQPVPRATAASRRLPGALPATRSLEDTPLAGTSSGGLLLEEPSSAAAQLPLADAAPPGGIPPGGAPGGGPSTGVLWAGTAPGGRPFGMVPFDCAPLGCAPSGCPPLGCAPLGWAPFGWACPLESAPSPTGDCPLAPAVPPVSGRL